MSAHRVSFSFWRRKVKSLSLDENETLTGQSGAGLGAGGPEEQLRQQLTSQCERRSVQVRIACRQGWVRVVPRLVVVVLHVQVLHLAVIYAQRAARVVDILTVKALQNNVFFFF